MQSGQTRKWVLGGLALVAIYVSVTWVAWHLKPVKLSPRPAAEQSDGPTLVLELGNGVHLDLVRIPAGQFKMGSPESEKDRDPSEGPQHVVRIARDFYMGKFDVTQEQWMAVMKDNQSAFKDRGDLPEEQVSWDDCQKFCLLVSKATGRLIRLPSEAEWEYSCRAGTTGPFWVGDSLSSTQANFDGEAPYGGGAAGPKRDRTTAVGSFTANAFGLFDMHGNVWQWCQDVFHPNYTGAPSDGSAWETGGDANVRVYRGGAWNNAGKNCRSAIRYANSHDLRTNVLGFRVAADLLPATKQ